MRYLMDRGIQGALSIEGSAQSDPGQGQVYEIAVIQRTCTNSFGETTCRPFSQLPHIGSVSFDSGNIGIQIRSHQGTR